MFLTVANVAPKEALILRKPPMLCMARVSKDGRAAHPPSLLRNFGATSIGLPSRSPQGEGWFETALKKRLLTMRFPCGRATSPVSSKRVGPPGPAFGRPDDR